MNSSAPLVLAGVGFVAENVALAASGRRILGTTRNPDSVGRLRALGIEALVLTSGFESVLPATVAGADVLVTFPPDGRSDSELAAKLGDARRIVYVSSTGVYGDTRGRISNETPAAPNDDSNTRRVEAEAMWRSAGATIIRAPGIYGPARGLHRSLANGSYRMVGDGSGVISRIHVEDLARVLLAAMETGTPGSTMVVADLCPVPQREVIDWLCEKLGADRPSSVPFEQAPMTLRGSRAVDPSATLNALGVTLRFPSYREGFAACLESDPTFTGASSAPRE